MILSGLTLSGRTISTTVSSIPTDPDYSSVSLLLHGDGTNNSTVFTDNSPSPKTPTVTGAPKITTAVKQFGTGSIQFAAGSDKFYYADNAAFNFGTGNFTLEASVNFNNVNTEQVIFNKGWQETPSFAPFLVYMTNTGSLRFYASSTGSSWNIANDRVIAAMTGANVGVWTRIAVTRSGDTFRAFINGVIQPLFTFTLGSSLSLVNSATQRMNIGSRIAAGSSLNGYIDEVRITKGVARYTDTYTPATQAFPNS